MIQRRKSFPSRQRHSDLISRKPSPLKEARAARERCQATWPWRQRQTAPRHRASESGWLAIAYRVRRSVRTDGHGTRSGHGQIHVRTRSGGDQIHGRGTLSRGGTRNRGGQIHDRSRPCRSRPRQSGPRQRRPHLRREWPTHPYLHREWPTHSTSRRPWRSPRRPNQSLSCAS